MTINYARDQHFINILRYSLGSLQLVTEIVSALTGSSGLFGVNSITTLDPSTFTSISSFGSPGVAFTCKDINIYIKL